MFLDDDGDDTTYVEHAPAGGFRKGDLRQMMWHVVTPAGPKLPPRSMLACTATNISKSSAGAASAASAVFEGFGCKNSIGYPIHTVQPKLYKPLCLPAKRSCFVACAMFLSVSLRRS